MGRPQEVVNVRLAEQARAELSRIHDARMCLRLQAIASCVHFPMSVVAAVFGVNRRAVWQWARRFREQGIEGLRDRPKGHRPPRLTAEQMAEVEGWMAEGHNHQGEPTHWTLARLQGEIVKRFGVQIGITALWKRVRALDFRQKVPRPHHRLADPEQQEAFKKKSLRLPRPT